MTREQAIEHGKEQLEIFGGEHREFIEMAIKALEHPEKNVIAVVPCGDAISRQAALNLFNKSAEYSWEMSLLKRNIEELPSVTPQEPRWIPTSERLPEDRREVLVTAYWHETYQVMMASYFGDGLWWCVPYNNCGEHMQRLKPKAWMPLPAPFDPQERSDKG